MDLQDSSTEPTMCPDDWHELIAAARAAGRWAARELARRCSLWELGRPGQVWIYIEPVNSPVAGWLLRQGRAQSMPDNSGVLVPVELAARDLFPADNPVAKAESVLVARAYATAYCTVLAEEAGVAAELRIAPTMPQQPPSDGPVEAAVSSTATLNGPTAATHRVTPG